MPQFAPSHRFQRFLQTTLPKLSPSTINALIPHHPIYLPHCLFSTTRFHSADFTHAIIGAGAVGLAIARHLAITHPNTRTLLLEKHCHIGTETSSRNSEVIHAGLYYGHDTLKTKLCLKGREMMYALCKKESIGHMNCGKWIVAQDEQQMEALRGVRDFAESVGVPTRWVGREEKERREKDVKAEAGVLESMSTGILDSHGFMQFLCGSFEEAGGEVALNSGVSRIEGVDGGKGGWRIWTDEAEGESEEPIIVEVIINSAGLYSCDIQNMILPKERHRQPYYAKGSYYSYSASTPKPKTLVYPAPIPGHGGLGTHLTFDLAGRIRFGPDIEWIDSPTNYTPNGKGLQQALDDIQTYLPGLKREEVHVDYCGIRPKLSRQSAQLHGKNFTDFHIVKEEGVEGFVNLLGIESPGLTSSLAIAEYVERLLYR